MGSGFLEGVLHRGFRFFTGKSRGGDNFNGAGEGFFLRGQVGIFGQISPVEPHAVGTRHAEGKHTDLMEIFASKAVGQTRKLPCAFVIQQVEDPPAGFEACQDVARTKITVCDSGGMHTADGMTQFFDEATAKTKIGCINLPPGLSHPGVDIRGVENFPGDQKAGLKDRAEFFDSNGNNGRTSNIMFQKSDRPDTGPPGSAENEQVLENIEGGTLQVFLENQTVFIAVEVQNAAEDTSKVGGGDGGDGTANAVEDF